MDSYTQKGMPMGAEEVSASRMMDEAEPAPQGRGPAPIVTITQQDGRFMVAISTPRATAAANGPRDAQVQNYAFASLGEVAPVVAQAFGVEMPAERAGGSEMPMSPMGRG